MDTALETIRLALEAEASPEARSAGVAACRAILAALDPSAAPPQQRPNAAIDASQIAALVGALRGVPPDQSLDLAIAKLRAALPSDAATPPAPKGIAFHLVPINRSVPR